MTRISPQQMSATLLAAARQATIDARAVVQRGALNIKNESRRNVAASAPQHSGHAANAITYDTQAGGTRLLRPSAEIGYDKDKKIGRLGNLLEFGGGGDKSPAHRDLGRALDNEEPRFIAALQNILDPLGRVR